MTFLTELEDSEQSHCSLELRKEETTNRDIRKWVSVGSFLLEGLLFTGIVFGFPNLKVILKREGIWTTPEGISKIYS